MDDLAGRLRRLLEGEGERVGLITAAGEIVELENVHDDPTEGFRLAGADALRLLAPDVVGTWHTHPGAGRNLSLADREAFLDPSWRRLVHHVVGTDGVAAYRVDVDGALIREDLP